MRRSNDRHRAKPVQAEDLGDTFVQLDRRLACAADAGKQEHLLQRNAVVYRPVEIRCRLMIPLGDVEPNNPPGTLDQDLSANTKQLSGVATFGEPVADVFSIHRLSPALCRVKVLP